MGCITPKTTPHSAAIVYICHQDSALSPTNNITSHTPTTPLDIHIFSSPNLIQLQIRPFQRPQRHHLPRSQDKDNDTTSLIRDRPTASNQSTGYSQVRRKQAASLYGGPNRWEGSPTQSLMPPIPRHTPVVKAIFERVGNGGFKIVGEEMDESEAMSSSSHLQRFLIAARHPPSRSCWPWFDQSPNQDGERLSLHYHHRAWNHQGHQGEALLCRSQLWAGNPDCCAVFCTGEELWISRSCRKEGRARG